MDTMIVPVFTFLEYNLIFMKRTFSIFSLLFFLTLFDSFSQNRSITFTEKPWPEIMAMAKKENKLIFMDAYATWCGPCKWMAANMFTNDSIADFFNLNFICTKFNMELGEGMELAKKYGVRAYPTLLFIDTAGNMVHKRVGAPRKSEEYISTGIMAKDPDRNLAFQLKKYQSGDRNPDFLFGYCELLQQAYIPVTQTLGEYFLTVKEEEMISRSNWRLIYAYTEDMNSPEFLYLVKNQQKFRKLYTPDSVSQKIEQVYLGTLQNLMRSKTFSEDVYRTTKTKIKESGYQGADRIIFTSDLTIFLRKGQIAAFLDLAYTDLEKNSGNDPAMLSEMAMLVSSRTTDVKYLEKAGQWAKRSIDLKSQPENNDIYATILVKLGKKDEAIAYETAAIALARKQGKPARKYEDALKKMQE